MAACIASLLYTKLACLFSACFVTASIHLQCYTKPISIKQGTVHSNACAELCCTGPLANTDPAPFANKAAQLNVLPTLAQLTQNKQTSQASRKVLLSLMCAAIAAFDLSPYTLPASQLQSVVDTLANLYEGKIHDLHVLIAHCTAKPP